MGRLRDDPARLRRQTYPQMLEMRVSYADVDSFQHLNSVALGRFFEEARASMNMGLFGVDTVVRPSAGVQLLFANIAIDYVSQGRYPGMVSIGTAVSKIGRSSFTQAAALFQDDRCIALCDAVTVFAKDGQAADLPSDIRAALETLSFRS